MNRPFMTGRILPDLSQPAVFPAKQSMGRKRLILDDHLKDLVGQGLSDQDMAVHFGCTESLVRLRRQKLKLFRSRGRPSRLGVIPKQMRRVAKHYSRHVPEGLAGKVARMPAYDDPAMTEGRTRYSASVKPVSGLRNLLVQGENSWKIGGLITKGAWKGSPVYTLTLEERATCPGSCALWRSCYGNNMPFAKRVRHGPELESRLGLEVGVLASRHPDGFAIRLHVLGDFYSIEYVALWRSLIELHPNLRIFGFTARIDVGAPITKALVALVTDHWPRAAIRFSNAPVEIASTVTIEHPFQNPADAILCPAQLGKTASCGTCALCWSTDRRIAFLRH